MVYRVYVEKKREFAHEAKTLENAASSFLQISSLKEVRIINRYDVENIDKELFDACIDTVFSEPPTDIVSDKLKKTSGCTVFAVEYLPGQFDQRADSAAQCIQLISKKERPTVKTARVYVLKGELSESDIDAIKNYVINPVEAREASLDEFDTLEMNIIPPDETPVLNGFCKLDKAGLADFINKYSLAMDIDDIAFCQNYFIFEKRDPTITEIRMIDTYWSDHCRHTTFLTEIESVKFEDSEIQKVYENYLDVRRDLGRESRSITFMDIATIAVKMLKKSGNLPKLDESEEINACTVKIDVNVDGETQKWLLLFKNETHNHPTEIEPFGGAATCIGGAIRDPLSGRSYVYAAMRVTGAADPRRGIKDTMKGKLPQRKIVQDAAAGYSSYGNQIGLATGQVDEIYHEGYAAKRMEIGAVIAAAPAENVRRERPDAGDIILLIGGKTGRDGCGGATGSSKSHSVQSLETCGAEVQKGNAPEERKLQRLFRNKEASRLIKRCNDFGAGGVSVAIGELADGLLIDLNAVPKKYEGLDSTELAISESQERMAVVVAPEDEARFIELSDKENLFATRVAVVTDNARLVMTHNGKNVVDISREFLNSNGASKFTDVLIKKPESFKKTAPSDFKKGMESLAADLNACSKRGLSERFDSTIGAGTVLMPFGGKNQITPNQAMVNKICLEKGDTDTVSLMAWGYNPFIAEKSPFHGAYLAVVESVSKLIAAGADFSDVYLTFQEYFEKPKTDPVRWGKPMAALLGAFKAQKDLKIAAIGGKDSMSGSFENIDVPPTLVSFAVTTDKINNIISPEFKGFGNKVILIAPEYDTNNLPKAESLIKNFGTVSRIVREGKVLSAYTPTYGGIAEGIMKMTFGNSVGFKFSDISLDEIFGYSYGAFILEVTDDVEIGTLLGETTQNEKIEYSGDFVRISDIQAIYESVLEDVYPTNTSEKAKKIPSLDYSGGRIAFTSTKIAKPKALIPVFPGTNCEYDSAKALENAGAEAEIIVINNMTAQGIEESVKYFAKQMSKSQIVFIPGGFSGGDEPDGSGKFITAFFRNPEVSQAVTDLLEVRDGLMCGICNGFQALIKLGLVPFGKIVEMNEQSPTLTFNTIGRHQSRIVRTRVASNKSPWLSKTNVGDEYSVPISHGEGRFLADEALIKMLAENGQIATQYVDQNGEPTYDILYNPNGSVFAVEGITSPDGRVFGKMGHSERVGKGLYKNVLGDYNINMFESAVDYFS